MSFQLDIDYLSQIKADVDADPDGFRKELDPLPAQKMSPGLFADLGELGTFAPVRALRIHEPEAV